jgi:hypothetical protein
MRSSQRCGGTDLCYLVPADGKMAISRLDSHLQRECPSLAPLGGRPLNIRVLSKRLSRWNLTESMTYRKSRRINRLTVFDSITTRYGLLKFVMS